jgi:hypothetical protein
VLVKSHHNPPVVLKIILVFMHVSRLFVRLDLLIHILYEVWSKFRIFKRRDASFYKMFYNVNRLRNHIG